MRVAQAVGDRRAARKRSSHSRVIASAEVLDGVLAVQRGRTENCACADLERLIEQPRPTGKGRRP